MWGAPSTSNVVQQNIVRKPFPKSTQTLLCKDAFASTTIKKRGIIKRFDSAEEAVQFEDSYIEEFWDDPLFLNQKRGDTIDALYNERKHTKRFGI